jgi:hypothetical protein
MGVSVSTGTSVSAAVVPSAVGETGISVGGLVRFSSQF